MKNCFAIVFCVFNLFIISCNNSSQKDGKQKDDILTGKLKIMADESVYPILLEQKEVFESSYLAEIEIIAQPEVQAINGLLKGDAPLAFLTRNLSKEEQKVFDDRSITPRIYPVAYDGIVLVSHIQAKDSTIRIAAIIAALEGQASPRRLVFDNANSSVFRYFRDLVGEGKLKSTNVEVKENSEDVLAAVTEDVNRVGLISYNQFLTLKSSFKGIDKIRILGVLNEKLATPKYVKPSQETLSTDEYPLKREILVLNYQPNMGLGIGFSAFMTGDRGQRIVLKSGLLPATMPGREIIIRDGIN